MTQNSVIEHENIKYGIVSVRGKDLRGVATYKVFSGL